MHSRAIIYWQIIFLVSTVVAAETQRDLKVNISWGYRSEKDTAFHVKLLSEGMDTASASGTDMESGDTVHDGFWKTHAGGGDVDGLEFTLRYPEIDVKLTDNVHSIWAYLIKHSDNDTARRLLSDPAYRQDPRKLTVQMNSDQIKGFSVTLDQLLQSKTLWVPSLDIYLAAGETPISFSEHQAQLKQWAGKRILDQVHSEPEATYEQYKARWEDMGSPSYVNPHQPFPGHIICTTWDSAIYKFGIDRGAGIWSDLGSPDKHRFWYDFGDLSAGIAKSWKSQKLADGLPVITTVLENDGIKYEIEQFAYPLDGPLEERRGDIPMVLMQKVQVTNLSSSPREVSVVVNHQRELPATPRLQVIPQNNINTFCFEDCSSNRVLFTVRGEALNVRDVTEQSAQPEQHDKKDSPKRTSRIAISFELPSKDSHELFVHLPSPPVASENISKLIALSHDKARSETLQFWSDYVARGARFRVPEEAVNELFRANLWHALRLPRRHGGQELNVRIDLPYSNFAYSQNGTPWPVNEAVYVDYMLYDLRGYHDISLEEMLTIYRNNQDASGHVGGYANWGVYTPSMIYVVSKSFLLSGDRKALEELLPYTLKALDWCLTEIERNSDRPGPSSGLVRSPLNDGTGDCFWAFTQAYMYAGLDLFGRVLDEIDHPRARECLTGASKFKQAVERGFIAAMVQSPLVQLQDHTWIPYVPCEAWKSGRLLQQWYPTDVDTGAVHLLRLKALPADGMLADCLLNDHEDNLYLKCWGMANEPVYNQQATVYLLREDPKAVIRAFYSYMACAFSHSVYEPVEHRWAWGQYFGPPSTDGAWFELYRNMLIHELDDDTLLLLQATPRKWLGDGKAIIVERAPTYYGRLSMTVESQAAMNKLTAEIEMPDRGHPKVLLVRFRHPTGKHIKSVTVNGRNWTDFNVEKEWVRITNPSQNRYSITVSY